jgi:hypothetical protein
MWIRRSTGNVMAMSHSETAHLPLPGTGEQAVAATAPGPGPQNWAGAPGAALDEDGTIVLGYRVRYAGDRDEVVVARSEDGEHLETAAILTREQFSAEMVERPSLVRTQTGAWRLYMSCATPGTKHWRVDAVEAPTLEGLAVAHPQPAFPGDLSTVAVKDPVVRRGPDGWHAWLCCHLLDEPGEEDRMNSSYATSDDGWTWRHHGTILEGRPGMWDQRGARVSTVLGNGLFAYDGRASAEENWWERTGVARRADDGRLRAVDIEPVAATRYLEVLDLPGGGRRIWYESALPDESHELRTELIA